MREHVPDRDLVAASIGGDVRAFGTLVERHHAAVTSVAFAITRDLALSEDIAQETFVVAWTRLAELRDPASVRAWLCNIARNQSKNELRRRTRDAGAPADTLADPRPSPVDTAITHEAEDQLRTVLAALPAAYREPLVLFYWQEQSIQHVASALAISEQAAQKRISRARSMVGEEYEARFDELARARRPATAAAAGVVAVLAFRAGPAAAASGAAKRGITMKGLMTITGLATTALAVGVVVWHYADPNGAAASSPPATAAVRPQATPDTTAAPTGAKRAAPTPALTGPSEAQKLEVKGGFGVPDAYEVTVLAPTSVAVNLTGGTSSTYLWQDPPAPTFERRVRGRVLDNAGKPLAGAAVLVGDKFRVMWGSLMADQGGMTNHAGAFDVALHSDEAVYALALHPRAGWSQRVAVPAGRGDAEIQIRVPRPAGLAGQVRRAKLPIEGELQIASEGGTLGIVLETDARGRFDLPLLPPGSYRVSASPTQLVAGGAGRRAEQEVVLESGRKRDVTLDVPAGALVIVTSQDASKLSTIEFVLVPGRDVQPDAAALRALSRSGKAIAYLLGGQDVDRPMQFHDVAPGEYTLCVERKLDRETALPVKCQKLVVPADKQVLEIEVSP